MELRRLAQDADPDDPLQALERKDLPVEGNQQTRPDDDSDSRQGPDEEYERSPRSFFPLFPLPALFLLIIVHCIL
jgi:hypothetical protein